MNKNFTIRMLLRFVRILVFVLLMGLDYSSIGQPPPPPGGSSGVGRENGNKLGGATPVGGGIFILLGLGGAYGAFKLYKNNKRSLID